jgi:Fe-S-cluster containining protein
MEIRQTAPDGIEGQLEPLAGGSFRFACHPGVPCFTECCRDLNLLLTPYDVLRLKNRLGLSSSEFLDRHAECRFDEGRNVPKMYLLMNEDGGKACPFVTPAGCSLYEDRPSACRIYPIARASRVHRVHGTVLENYFVLRENHCRGFEEGRSWEIGEWLSDQGLRAYYESNDRWMEIVTHPRLINGPLTPNQQQVFYLGSYDIDKFRRMVFGGRFLSAFEIPEDEVEKIGSDEGALLNFAFKWMKFTLFGEQVLKLRHG